jgi:hypothetical protein
MDQSPQLAGRLMVERYQIVPRIGRGAKKLGFSEEAWLFGEIDGVGWVKLVG